MNQNEITKLSILSSKIEGRRYCQNLEGNNTSALNLRIEFNVTMQCLLK